MNNIELASRIVEMNSMEIESISGGRWLTYLDIIQAAEYLGDKAYELGYWMGSH
jgi:hypothetical protein